jgi:hypothetical protein
MRRSVEMFFRRGGQFLGQAWNKHGFCAEMLAKMELAHG